MLQLSFTCSCQGNSCFRINAQTIVCLSSQTLQTFHVFISWLLTGLFFIGALPRILILLASQEQYSTSPKSGGIFLNCMFIHYLFTFQQAYNYCQLTSQLPHPQWFICLPRQIILPF